MDSIRAERWLQPFMIDAINNAPRMHNVNEGADAKLTIKATACIRLWRDGIHLQTCLEVGRHHA